MSPQTLRGVITPASLGVMTQTSYLAKFGNYTDHRFDPCPISGRCGTCGIASEWHPVNVRAPKREEK